MALAHAHNMIFQVQHRQSFNLQLISLDDEIIQTSLLSATDSFVFGNDSTQSAWHAKGLKTLLGQQPRTSTLVPRFQRVSAHTWRDAPGRFSCVCAIRGNENPSQYDRERSCNSHLKDLHRHLQRNARDIAANGESREYRRAERFWTNFIPGVWAIWNPEKCDAVDKISRTTRFNTLLTYTDMKHQQDDRHCQEDDDAGYFSEYG